MAKSGVNRALSQLEQEELRAEGKRIMEKEKRDKERYGPTKYTTGERIAGAITRLGQRFWGDGSLSVGKAANDKRNRTDVIQQYADET